MKWIRSLALLTILLAPSAVLSADYSVKLQNKRLIMKGAKSAGIEFKSKKTIIGYAELTGDIPAYEGLVKWVRNDLFLVVEKGRVSENCPPRTWLYEIVRSSNQSIMLKEYWTGWPESKDEVIEYRVTPSPIPAEQADLVFRGTVEKVEASPLPNSRLSWIVHCRVDQVLSGAFQNKTFSFRVHSPVKSGLEVGKQYEIKARRTSDGYTVDPYQWKK